MTPKGEQLREWLQTIASKVPRTTALSCSQKTGITSKHHGDIYCLNCFHSFATENKLQLHLKVCENKDFCNIIMPSHGIKILEFTQYQKSDKAPFIISEDLECVREKMDGCKK